MKAQKIQKILNRDFVLCVLAQFALSSGYYVLLPTLPIYLSRLGSTEAEIGVLIGSFGVSALVLRPFVGRALLKIPEKKMMIEGALLSVLTSIAYLLVLPFWPLLIVIILQGMSFALFHTSSSTLIANISPAAYRGQSLGYFYLAFNLSSALAPPFGMFLIKHFHFPLFFLACAGLCLCALFIATQLGRRQVDLLQDTFVEDSSFFSRKAIPPSISIFLTHMGWGTLTTFLPLYALNQGVGNPGFFFTVYGGILILGRSLGGGISDLYSREKVVLPCIAMYTLAMSLLAFSKTLPMFILVAVIYGIGNTFIFPALVAYTIELAGSSRGPVMGTITASMDLGMALGPVIMGIILQLTSYPIMFLCLALTGVINLNYFCFFVKKKDNLSIQKKILG